MGKKRGLRLVWRPRARAILAYMIALLVTVAVILDPGVFIPQGPVVTVFAPRDPEVSSRFQGFLDALDYPRASLMATIPGLTQWCEGADELNDASQAGVELAVYAIAGIDPRDPGSFLRAALPTFFAASPPSWAAPVAEVIPSPVSPVIEQAEEKTPLPTPTEPLVGIYHTHARESFLPEVAPGSTNFEEAQSWDMSLTIVEVGRYLAEQLGSEGIGVVHSAVVHDDPGRLGAYLRSLPTAEQMLRDNPSIRILLDIHRDARPRKDTTVTVGGKSAARVMVVLGTDQRLPHPQWKKNYEFALALVRNMECSYPGLSLGIYPKMDRYNQHLLPGALLLEVGGVENTLAECFWTADILSDVISGMIKSGEIP